MGSEKQLRTRTREAVQSLPQYADYQRIENMIGAGTPDVNFCYRGREFWVELKYLDAFPKREATPVRIKTLTEDQVSWLCCRQQAGGFAYLFVQVGKEYFVFKNQKDIVSVYFGKNQTWWRSHAKNFDTCKEAISFITRSKRL